MTEVLSEENAAAFKASMIAQVPIGLLGRPDEVTAAVAFLASADSSFLIAANLYVDGGENQI